jgi:hypothetical protein
MDTNNKVQDIEEKIQIILRQTDYTREIAEEKLKEFDWNEINVVKDYFGINKKRENNTINKPINVNQEIYKQLRTYLDASMKEYRENKQTSG